MGVGDNSSSGTEYKGTSGADRVWAKMGGDVVDRWRERDETRRLEELDLEAERVSQENQLKYAMISSGQATLDKDGNMVPGPGKPEGQKEWLELRKAFATEAKNQFGDPSTELDPNKAAASRAAIQNYIEDRMFKGSGVGAVLDSSLLSPGNMEDYALLTGKSVVYEAPSGKLYPDKRKGTRMTLASKATHEKLMDIPKPEKKGPQHVGPRNGWETASMLGGWGTDLLAGGAAVKELFGQGKVLWQTFSEAQKIKYLASGNPALQNAAIEKYLGSITKGLKIYGGKEAGISDKVAKALVAKTKREMAKRAAEGATSYGLLPHTGARSALWGSLAPALSGYWKGKARAMALEGAENLIDAGGTNMRDQTKAGVQKMMNFENPWAGQNDPYIGQGAIDVMLQNPGAWNKGQYGDIGVSSIPPDQRSKFGVTRGPGGGYRGTRSY
jgi:hypothetical protein